MSIRNSLPSSFRRGRAYQGNRPTGPLWRRPVVLATGLGALLLLGWWLWGGLPTAPSNQQAEVVVYASPDCSCCQGWVQHLRQNGFTVAVENVRNLESVKKRLGVPEPLTSCHTATLHGYVVEGHVPAADLQRLLNEKPNVKGIAVPGMPVGSPGMEVPGQKPERYTVVTFTQDGRTQFFANH